MSNEYFFKSLQEFPFATQEVHPYTKRSFADVIDLEWNSTGSKIAFSKLDRSVYVLHRSYEKIENFQMINNAHDKPVEKIAFHPIKEYVFCTVANSNEVKIWETNHNATSYKPLQTIKLHPSYRNFICSFSPDGEYLLIIDKANHITIISTATYEPVITFKESSNVYDFTWSNTSKFFILGLDNGLTTINEFNKKIHLFEIPIFEIHRVHSINSGLQNSIIKQVKFDPRGEFFITGSQQGVIQIYSTASLTCIRSISEVDELITCVDISRDGTYAVVCFELNNAARVYDLSDGVENFKLVNCISGKKTSCLLKFCPTKTNLLFSSFQDGGIIFLNKPMASSQAPMGKQRSRN